MHTKTPDTIYNFCTTSHSIKEMCDKVFWINKFKHEKLPMIKHQKSFEKWINLYRASIKLHCEAKALLNIVKIYYTNHTKQPPKFTIMSNLLYIEFNYKDDNWFKNINNIVDKISKDDLIYMVTHALILFKYRKDDDMMIFLDDNTFNTLIYDELKNRKTKAIEKIILSMYQLLEVMGNLDC